MSRAVWILWLIAHGHPSAQVRIYATAATCERVAAYLNTTSPELGLAVCFRKTAEQPYAY